MLIGARLGSPLVVGYGEGETYLGSDALALAPLTQQIAYLEEGDWVVITREGAAIFDKDNNAVEREVTTSGASAAAIEKGNYRHFMQKEIFEQPTVVAQTLRSYLRPVEQQVALPQIDFDISAIERVTIVACGTSYYAGMVAKYWFEQFARVPVDIDFASEFRYREPVLSAGRAGAVHLAKRARPPTRSRRCATARRKARRSRWWSTSRPARWRARRTCCCRPTPGPEIGVASTKAFTCQLAVLAALAAHLAVKKGRIDRERGSRDRPPPARGAGRAQRRARPRRRDRGDGAPDRPGARRALPRPRPGLSRWRWKARSSSRRSATSTPRAMPRAR